MLFCDKNLRIFKKEWINRVLFVQENGIDTDFSERCKISRCVKRNLSLWECIFFSFLDKTKFRNKLIIESDMTKFNKNWTEHEEHILGKASPLVSINDTSEDGVSEVSIYQLVYPKLTYIYCFNIGCFKTHCTIFKKR